jgi:predicted permease
MFKNYLKVAMRNILRHKGYSFINIAGLALGMACSIFLLLQVHHEQSFDTFHENANSLYRVEQDQPSPEGNFHVTVTPYPAGPEIKDNIPEIKNFSRWLYPGSMLVKYEDKVFYENTVTAVDPSFLQMFTFPLIAGDSKTALNDPFSVILSETMAEKYFGNQNPIGEKISLNNKFLFLVTGVMKDAPQNSTLRPEILIPFECMDEVANVYTGWGNNYLVTWVELNNDKQVANVSNKISNLVMERTISNAPAGITPEEVKRYRETQAPKYMLMPLIDINLYGYFGYGQVYGKIQSLKIFLIIAIFILLIACINYMNLATARAANRAKEIGLRKTVGAERKHIINQFFGESILLSFISFILSLLIVILLLPLFNNLTGEKFTIGAVFNLEFFLILLFVALFAGIVAGIYPALFLSSFNPTKVLKGSLSSSAKSNFFRKSLVVFQFSLSVILLIGTIVAFQQLNYMRLKKVGYEKDHLIYLPLRGETGKSYATLKQELLQQPNVVNVSGIDQPPTRIGANSGSAKWNGKDPNTKPLISIARVDFDFVETMQIELLEGRSFSTSYSTDSTKAFLVNEEVLRAMGTESGVGKNFDFQGVDGYIIGVMKNFNFQSAQVKIEPLAILFSKQPRYAVVRLKGGDIPAAIDDVKKVWQRVASLYPFEYRFIDDDFAQMYKSDEQMGEIFKYGAIFAIIIASLGLFGFASFMAQKRTKEIGIRKTLGASVTGIAVLLSKDFIKWVLVGNIIAWPIAYLLLNWWLQDYAYRISLDWWIFIIPTIITVLIAIVTVSSQSVKAALADPVKSLKYE